MRTFAGGSHSRHANWYSRLFWRTWSQFGRVNLDEGRRDYREYRSGTILEVYDRNYKLCGILYYYWVGCQRIATWGAVQVASREAAAVATAPPQFR